MAPFDVVTGRYGMNGNSGGVTNLSESFEVLRKTERQKDRKTERLSTSKLSHKL